MTEATLILEKMTKIQEALNLPDDRLSALANAMKGSPESCERIYDLFNDVQGSRYLGGEDRFLRFIESLTSDS